MALETAKLQWIRPPQQARSRETLERILEAAERLVGAKGFDDTSVAEVASEAGSSVGAFYARFQDKDGLLHALYERFLEQATATADDALDPARWADHSISQIVPEVVGFLVDIYRERRGVLRALVTRSHVDPQFRARQEWLSHYVSDKLTALLLERRDEIQRDDPETALAFGFSLAINHIEAVLLFGELRSGALSFSDHAFAQETARAYLAYLGVEPQENEPRPEPHLAKRSDDERA